MRILKTVRRCMNDQTGTWDRPSCAAMGSGETMESKKWYERKQPLRFRVWDGNAFAYECRLAVNGNGTRVIGEDGLPRENVQLQEWTGCLDNEKHEIYEGDFVMLMDEGWIGTVVFGDGEFWCRDEKGGYSSMVTFEDSLVVGNVFQGIDRSLVELEVRKRTNEDKKVDEAMAIMETISKTGVTK